MSGFNIYFFPSSLFYFYHDPESKSVTDTQTDRQTDRQIDRQRQRETDIQTGTQ